MSSLFRSLSRHGGAFKHAAAVSSVLFFALLCSSEAFPSVMNKLKGGQYKDWLEGPPSILATSEERQAFKGLRIEDERETFAQEFWNKRDPDPGTQENEFKKLFDERLAYAVRFLRKGYWEPAWKTDLGRAYILLGEPSSIADFGPRQGLVFCEVWSYESLDLACLPEPVDLIFYRRGRGEPFRLFDPCVDRLSVLIPGKKQKTDDEALEALRKAGTILAGAAETTDCRGIESAWTVAAFIKGPDDPPCSTAPDRLAFWAVKKREGSPPARRRPAPSTTPSPAKKTKAEPEKPRAKTKAKAKAKAKKEPAPTPGVQGLEAESGLKGTLYETHGSAVKTIQFMLQTPRGFPELGGSGNHMSATLITTITPLGTQTVEKEQKEEKTTVALDRNAASVVKERSFGLLGTVRVPPDTTGLEITLTQRETGRKFTYRGQIARKGILHSDILLGYVDPGAREHGEVSRPFKFLGPGVFPNLNRVYGKKDPLFLHLMVKLPSGAPPTEPVFSIWQDGREQKRVFCSASRFAREGSGRFSLTRPMHLEGLEPGIYTLKAELPESMTSSAELPFRILDQDYAERPWIVFKEESKEDVNINQALSTIRQGELDTGISQLQKLIEKSPGNYKARLVLGEALFLKGLYEKIPETKRRNLQDLQWSLLVRNNRYCS
ncbi:GWxTD domain-containing protein, partial [Acidobacteriota bacterium]